MNAITGEWLAAVKAAVKGTREAVYPFANEVTLVLEPGLDLVLLKTSKETGRHLRRLLVDENLDEGGGSGTRGGWGGRNSWEGTAYDEN